MITASSNVPGERVLAPLLSNENVAPGHFQLEFAAPGIARRARAGQFVHVLPRVAAGGDPLLRRAFSIMAVRGDRVQILFRVEGRGTAYLSRLQPGETMDVLGPLGHPFDLAPLLDNAEAAAASFHVKQEARAVLVGGGVGVPPLLFLAQTLCDAHLAPLILVGARGASDVLGAREFARLGLEMRVATDDGSMGHHGRVTELLEAALAQTPGAKVYSCGPYPMLRATAQVAARFGAACQVSLEENMPCGIGVCNGCVVAMRVPATQDASDYERYRRICIAGPAVWADQVEWE